ncbi:Nuclear fragile X mental retardation-interacting protein 1 (Nuclear FMRP-interacting protein 1) [Durusdinium trenchii]|uniref:Nuclear fragile X mental retardation-interacting protein 1 (Nuclear FMRP-interacting protein 1) n=1 Tax=Durusdinium trenchii TaxID=1381693 RepID=A0ABP0M439_9DINO
MGPRSEPRRRPIYHGESLPPPPAPPPSRISPLSTLDRVRDFLDRAGFEGPEERPKDRNDRRVRSKDAESRSTSEIRRLPKSSGSKPQSQRGKLPDPPAPPDPPTPPTPPAPPVPPVPPTPPATLSVTPPAPLLAPPAPPAPPSVPTLPPTPPIPPGPPAPPAPPVPPAPPTMKRARSVSQERVLPPPLPPAAETRQSKRQRFPDPPPPPEPRLPRPPPPPKPVWHEYEEDDYDYDYYQTWDEDEEDERYFTEREGRFELFSHSSDDEDNQSQVSYLPPPPMPGDFALPPPPPAVPKGWGKASRFTSRRNMAVTHSKWFCNLCNKDFWNEEKYNIHVQDDHIPCPEDGCSFSGPEFVMAVHRLKHVKAADGSSVTDSPEELAAWKAMRKANFPSKGNLQRKAEMEEKRRLSGALPDPPKVSMLEKLLRRTHGVERSGKGFGYKGCGKKGKDGKGKGKFSGKKGKGKNRWTLDHDGDQERHHNHPTYAVPLPSVVANCVPLEAPFGIQHHVNVAPTQQFKWGLCRFFERGFCFHGENCQYEHSGASAQQVISSTAWWALPSSLANRAGRPGEGPAGGVFGSLRSRQLRPTRVEPYVVRDPRERRDGLLRRLLQPDVERYYSAILQCVRYIVSTDFLRLERPHIEGQPEVQPQPSPVQQAATEQPGDEPDNQLMDTEPTDLDDEEIAGLGSLLRKE